MKKTIKFLSVCLGAPMVALGVGAPIAWAAPGNNCSVSCLVGGNAPGSPAKGGHYNGVVIGLVTQSGSGTTGAGHNVQTSNDTVVGTFSGNAKAGIPTSKGHCTGTFLSDCS